MKNLYYVLKGHEAVATESMAEWGVMFRDHVARTVAKTTVGDVSISTVFLGMDHGWGEGPPLLFETMVFGGKLEGEMERYSTWEEAEAGHAAMVERVKG